MTERQAVEIARTADDGVSPGLVVDRRTDGPDDGPQQRRVVVATVQDGALQKLDTAAERVQPADDPRLVRSVVGDRLDAEVSE